MEEAELLLAVSGMVGGVQIEEDDLLGARMGLEVQPQQLVCKAARVLGSNPVLKAGLGGCEAKSPDVCGALLAMILKAGLWSGCQRHWHPWSPKR